MSEIVNLVLTPRQASDSKYIRHAVSEALHISESGIGNFRIVRKTIDARQREPKIMLSVQVFSNMEDAADMYEIPHYKDVHNSTHKVIVVGSGPAGLFAALQLIESGVKPIIFERGKDVSNRKIDIAQLNRNNGLNTESNYCFGEGGAGTFSDGKLYSRSKKRGNIQRIMEIFHYHGAADSILYEAHPHIGSDRLPQIIKHIRQTILDNGGEIYFRHRVDKLIIDDKTIKGCIVSDLSLPSRQPLRFDADAVILAIGHSAHDTYRMLAESGVALETKGFALGVRVEHPQALIDKLMYHGVSRGDYLPAASYSLSTQVEGRGVYSFCMCPGGHIVPAGSEKQSCVVNGMSASQRNSPYANSGIVVEIHPEDLPVDNQTALGALEYQEQIEKEAWIQSHHYVTDSQAASIAPAQRLKDFVEGRDSTSLPPCSYLPGIVSSRLDRWLPAMIAKRLQQGFRDFNRKYPGFLTNDAVIVGVESRSSSPIRIPRDKVTMCHIDIKRLYPCGEGAGYAGGITSSAMDGISAAIAACESIKI